MRPFVGDGKMKRSMVADGNAAVEMALGLLSVLLYRSWMELMGVTIFGVDGESMGERERWNAHVCCVPILLKLSLLLPI